MQKNLVLVGHKPIMAYVMSALQALNNGNAEIHIKAGGKNISKAVDIEQILKNRYMKELKTKEIRTATEIIKSERDNKNFNISAIEIVLARE